MSLYCYGESDLIASVKRVQKFEFTEALCSIEDLLEKADAY